MRKVFALLFLGLFLASLASAATKIQVRDVLQKELQVYFEGRQTVMTVDELRTFVNYYDSMPRNSDVAIADMPLSANVKNILEIMINPSLGSGGYVPEETDDEDMVKLNGRKNGVYCGDLNNSICQSRYCSPLWDICEPNPLKLSEMKELNEDCTDGNQCKTGVCRGGRCYVKSCKFDAQCTSGKCKTVYMWWGNYRSFCDGDGY